MSGGISGNRRKSRNLWQFSQSAINILSALCSGHFPLQAHNVSWKNINTILIAEFNSRFCFYFFPTDVEIPMLKKIMSIPLGCYCYLTDRGNKFQTQFLLIRTEFRFYLNSAIMSKLNLYYGIKFHTSKEKNCSKYCCLWLHVVFNVNSKIWDSEAL